MMIAQRGLTNADLDGLFAQAHAAEGAGRTRDALGSPIKGLLSKAYAKERMGYTFDTAARTSGPINAIYFDHDHGTFWAGSSDDGDDYGIAW